MLVGYSEDQEVFRPGIWWAYLLCVVFTGFLVPVFEYMDGAGMLVVARWFFTLLLSGGFSESQSFHGRLKDGYHSILAKIHMVEAAVFLALSLILVHVCVGVL
jgi:hypothetical protein